MNRRQRSKRRRQRQMPPARWLEWLHHSQRLGVPPLWRRRQTYAPPVDYYVRKVYARFQLATPDGTPIRVD